MVVTAHPAPNNVPRFLGRCAGRHHADGWAGAMDQYMP